MQMGAAYELGKPVEQAEHYQRHARHLFEKQADSTYLSDENESGEASDAHSAGEDPSNDLDESA